jgi:periplasmic protein TonB
MNSPILKPLVYEQFSAPDLVKPVIRHELGAVKQVVPALSATYSKKTLAVVLMLHVLVIIQLLRQVNEAPEPQKSLEPMMVSLIAAPQQTVSDTQPENKSELVHKKALPILRSVEKVQKINQAQSEPIKTIDKPAEQVATASLKATQNEMKLEAAPTQPVEAEATKVASKSITAIDEHMSEAASNEVIEPPQFGVAYLNNPAPEYPALSRRSGEEGRVLMKVLVSTDGAAETVQIEKSSGSERLDQAAMNAVKRWRFIPAQKNKQPLSTYVLVPMKFALNS